MSYISKKERELKEILLKGMGWTVYIATCSDESLFSGMTRDLKKEMFDIYKARGRPHFASWRKFLPLKIMYQEDHVPFREAFAKLSYLKECNRTTKLYVIRNKKICENWRMYLRGFRDKNSKTA